MKLTPKYFENLKTARKGRYLLAGKISTYYEVYGKGRPLLLFHGGLSCIDGLRYQIPFFAKHFKVYIPERPGHGHTADIAQDYDYETLAAQTADFMDALKIKKAKMLGYSDGANLIFWLAAKRPDLVERFVSVGGNIHYSGIDKKFQADLKKQKVKIDPRYAAYSPDGRKHYADVFRKCRKLWLTEPRWKVSLLRKIKAPGLVVAGDRDVVTHEHSLEIFRNLKHSQLAVIPGASHSLLKEKPDLVNPLLLDFFQETSNR